MALRSTFPSSGDDMVDLKQGEDGESELFTELAKMVPTAPECPALEKVSLPVTPLPSEEAALLT